MSESKSKQPTKFPAEQGISRTSNEAGSDRSPAEHGMSLDQQRLVEEERRLSCAQRALCGQVGVTVDGVPNDTTLESRRKAVLESLERSRRTRLKHLPEKARTRPASGPPTCAIDPEQPLAEALSAWADLCQRWGSWLADLLCREDFNAHTMARDKYNRLSQDIIDALATAWEEGGPLDPRWKRLIDRCRCEMPQPKAEIIIEIRRELSSVCDDAWKCAVEEGLFSGHGVAVPMATKTIPSIAERLLGLSKEEPPTATIDVQPTAEGKRSGRPGDNVDVLSADEAEIRYGKEALSVPTGRATEVFRQLIENVGGLVKYKDLGVEGLAPKEADDQTRKAVSDIRKVLKRDRIPYEIETLRRVGYRLQAKKTLRRNTVG